MRYVLSQPLSVHELGQRKNQEDSLYPLPGQLTPEQPFFILCDGMGGHASGEVASLTVCDVMGGYLSDRLSSGARFNRQLFDDALAAAYSALDARDNPETVRKMGTTMTFLMFCDEGAFVAHIGDSRIYQFRPGVAGPLFRTRDHSLVNDLVMLGELTEEEARNSPNRNVITRAVQPGVGNRTNADVAMLGDVRPGDWFYMCSDGMLERMDDAELGSILTSPDMTDAEKRDLLIVKTAGNCDNHTAFMIHVTGDGQASAGIADGDAVAVPASKVTPVTTGKTSPVPKASTAAYGRKNAKKGRPLPVVLVVVAIILLLAVAWHYLSPHFSK